MMLNEAKWFAKYLPHFEKGDLSPLVNIGSSTRHFREQEQPHIHEHVFKPLEARGIKVIHCDLKQAEGVDIQGDIFDDVFLATIKKQKPKAVLCTHMFEHVTDRASLAKRLFSLLPPGGLLLVTVPYSYPYHADPIDTLYRPSPEELAALFPDATVEKKMAVESGNYWDKIRARPLIIFRHIFRFPFPFLDFTRWKRSMHKLSWLFRPYKVSIVIARKNP